MTYPLRPELLFETMDLPSPRGKPFVGHQKILGLPQWMFSLSHTKEYAGAWMAPQQVGLGVGFDIELKSREVTEEIFKRFHHPDDINMNLTNHWAVKEAAYKSLPQDIQEKIWLNSIKVKRGSFEVSGQAVRGEWKILPHEKLIMACAIRLA
jgi:phosphopantetheinyl transferase (holo-ACP synthase)